MPEAETSKIPSPPLHLAATFRILVDVEAMNAIEPLGNVIRHRKASIAVPRGSSIEIVTVPVVSGEALRHAYQYTLAYLASLTNIPVCSWCRRGEFIKHGVLAETLYQDEKDLLKILQSNAAPEDKEFEIVKNCVVEDVAGFLVPAKEAPAKRTSRIQISFLIPSLVEVSKGVFAVDIQFHVRHAPQAEATTPQNVQPRPQSIYYVESASTVHTFSTTINIGGIGVAVGVNSVKVLDPSERIKRSLLAIEALAEVVKSGGIGGKQSSYMPHWIPLSGVVVVSKPVKLVPIPPHVENYASSTLTHIKNQVDTLTSIGLKNVKTYVAVFRSQLEVEAVKKDIESIGKPTEEKYKDIITVEKFDNVAELFKWVVGVVHEELRQELGVKQ